MSLTLATVLFLIAGIVAAIEAVRTRSLLAAAVALLAFAHIA